MIFVTRDSFDLNSILYETSTARPYLHCYSFHGMSFSVSFSQCVSLNQDQISFGQHRVGACAFNPLCCSVSLVSLMNYKMIIKGYLWVIGSNY